MAPAETPPRGDREEGDLYGNSLDDELADVPCRSSGLRDDSGLALPAAAQVDQQRAQEFFKDVQAVCEREGKRLWGMLLCGPMVIADPRTQTIATS